MYCRYCGQRMEEGTVYCGKCGFRLQDINPDFVHAIKKWKNGDGEGFREIYDGTYNHVYSRAKCIMQEEQEALDLLQEVYLVLYGKMDSLENDSDLFEWVTSITYRQGMGRLNRETTEIILTENGGETFEHILSDETMWEEIADKEQNANILRQCIEKLSEVQRLTVLAYYYEELKVEEIVELTESSMEIVKSRLCLALKNLKASMEEREQKQGCKPYVFTESVLILALDMMLDEGVLSEESADTLYTKVCVRAGIKGTKKGLVYHLFGSTWKRAVIAIIGVTIVITTGFFAWKAGDQTEKQPPARQNVVEDSEEDEDETQTQNTAEMEKIEEPEVQEPEVEVPDYYWDYKAAYEPIVQEMQGLYGEANFNYLDYSLYDMDGDGVSELIIQSGMNQMELLWNVYSYDIETGEEYQVGYFSGRHSRLCLPEGGGTGIVSVYGFQNEQEVRRIQMTSDKTLAITTIDPMRMLEDGEEFYKGAGDLQVSTADNLDLLNTTHGEDIRLDTGYQTADGKEIYMLHQNVIASSVFQEEGYNYSVNNLSDGDPGTCWAEGAEGHGEKEALVIYGDTDEKPIEAEGLAIMPGFCASEELYRKNGVPIKITISYNDKVITQSLEKQFLNPSKMQKEMIYIDFGECVQMDHCTIIIEEVREGSRYQDASISEMYLYTTKGNGES